MSEVRSRLLLLDIDGCPVVRANPMCGTQTLFEFFDMEVPVAQVTASQPKATCFGAVGRIPGKPRLVASHIAAGIIPGVELQWHLPYLHSLGPEVVHLVPVSRYPALDRHFPSLVRRRNSRWRHPRLRKLAAKLTLAHKIWLGQIVQMTEEEILSVTASDYGAIEQLKSLLNAFGLQLGMAAPRWKQPQRLFGSA